MSLRNSPALLHQKKNMLISVNKAEDHTGGAAVSIHLKSRLLLPIKAVKQCLYFLFSTHYLVLVTRI